MRKYGHALHILITAGLGIVFFSLVDEAIFPFLFHVSLFSFLTEVVWTPLGIAIYFALFAGAMYGLMYLLCKWRGDYRGWTMKNLTSVVSNSFKRAAIGIAVLFLAAGVFEFLYELDKINTSHSSSYIFLIDDSGSMSGNDPTYEREKAIGKIMSKQDKDFPYAVYEFSGTASQIRPMATYQSTDTYGFDSAGSDTNILGALNTVLDDLENGNLAGAGKSPRVLILSDGYSYNNGFEEAVERCRQNNVVVSTMLCGDVSGASLFVGLDPDLMENLATRTGGTHIAVEDASLLAGEMETAITFTLSHNLLSARYAYSNSFVYALLRFVFLSLLGVIWSWIKQKTYCCAHDHRFADTVFIVSCILCGVSVLLVEPLFFIGVPAPAIRLLFCTMWAICPGAFVQYIEAGGNGFNTDESATFSTSHTFGSYDKQF